MTISAPWSALSGVDILSVQHHLCPDLTWEIFMNLWNNTKSLSLRLVLLTINVVQDIYCKFSRYPWSLNVCTKFDNVFIWWKVSGMFSFHDSEYKLISTRWKQSIKIEPEQVYLRWIRDRWVTSPRPDIFLPKYFHHLIVTRWRPLRSTTTELTTHADNINITRVKRNCQKRKKDGRNSIIQPSNIWG